MAAGQRQLNAIYDSQITAPAPCTVLLAFTSMAPIPVRLLRPPIRPWPVGVGGLHEGLVEGHWPGGGEPPADAVERSARRPGYPPAEEWQRRQEAASAPYLAPSPGFR